jgi:thiol-disulfide isomerase/thioredoxin
MNKIFPLSLLFIFLFSNCSRTIPDHPLQNKKIQTLRFTSLNGEYRSFDEFKGKELVVGFWASWCSHSEPEVREFNQKAKELMQVSKHRRPIFLLISVDENEDFEILKGRINAEKFTSLEHGFSGNALDDELYLYFQAKELPTFFYINKLGIVKVVSHSVSDCFNR